jgi:hypothetical protein
VQKKVLAMTYDTAGQVSMFMYQVQVAGGTICAGH